MDCFINKTSSKMSSIRRNLAEYLIRSGNLELLCERVREKIA